ncbi:MAG: phage major capsid protein [Sphingomonadales bacterium]|nr:phage major capsid protein [Sphingomonadales bacterium]
MNRIKQLKETRGAKLKELNTLQQAAEKRAFTKDEGEKFDVLANEIQQLNSDLEREERAAGLADAAPLKEERAEQATDARLGLSPKEVRSYSLLKVVRALAEKRPLDGIEREASDAEARRLGRQPDGCFVPMEIFAGAPERRANTSGVAADGGYLVGTDIDYGNMVALLRNQSHVLSLGARVITGLKNDVSIPRQLTGATAYWLTETGQVTGSKATFGQIAMKPRRLAASVPYSKTLVAQSGLGIEAFVREDILAAFGTELDRVAINGAGASEPLGLLNLAAGDLAAGVTFGAAATWAKVVSFETNVETANALGLPGARYAYLTTPGVKGAWKTTPKVSAQAVFLWENGDLVNGYAARSTNQVPGNKVIFGDFSQVVYGEWLGNDVVVDPYTLADQNQIKVTIQKIVDMVIRQGKAFSNSSDAGNL